MYAPGPRFAAGGILAAALLASGCGSALSPSPAATPTAAATPAATRTTPLTPPASAIASPSPSASALPALTSPGLQAAVTADDIGTHLEALQAIADANGGTRATGTSGFDASVAYVSERLRAAGYSVEVVPVDAAGVPSANVIVDRAGTVSGDVVMLGAHVDSVQVGPGINDNGSGVAVLLVMAERLAEIGDPARTIRFAFWGAEEGGLHGSRAYVEGLTPEGRGRIGAYLNFDMLGSPNPLRLVYDEAGAAPGSAAITALFAAHFDAAGLAWEPVDLRGDSDHGPFSQAGIPTGGLFSGGIEPVTSAQATAFGAVAGQPADPCSHAACDTIANVSRASIDVMSDAVAHAIATLAASD